MRVIFLVNDLRELLPTQATSLLIMQSAHEGYSTLVVDLAGLIRASPEQVTLSAYEVRPQDLTVSELCQEAGQASRVLHTVDSEDIILIRTSPGRDTERLDVHIAWLQILIHLTEKGIRVRNSPSTLLLMLSKGYFLSGLAEWMPNSSITTLPEMALPDKEPHVIKPLFGSRGRGIELIQDKKIFDFKELSEDIYCIQEYLPHAKDGEHRVLVLNGQVLKHDKHPAAYKKISKEGEFRHNLALGAVAHKETLTEKQLDIAERISQWSQQKGIVFAGLDLMNETLIELNVFSPGGILGIKNTSGQDFTHDILDGLLKGTQDVPTCHNLGRPSVTQ